MNPKDLENLTKEEKIKLLEAIEEKERRERENQLAYAYPAEGPFSRDKYPKHLEFFKASALYKEVAMIASNRVGKTYAGSYETVLHLTGLYPDWWEGKRFSKPTTCWAVGKTNVSVRDIIQEKLLGPIKTHYGEGMIPKHLFSKTPTTRAGVPDAAQDIYVKHVSGGTSKLTLKSYEQGRGGFEGSTIDFIWLDEEPKDPGIYTECLTRTATTGGVLKCTFTPLEGLSNIVMMFLPGGLFPESGIASPTKYVVNLTWADAGPHLSEEAKNDLKASYQPYELEARTKGIPSLGSGRIYPINEEELVVEPFKIPREWPCAYGMDTGWSKTAVVFGAIDPNTNTLYIYDEYYRGQQEPAVHVASIKARGDWLYGAIDYAGVNISDGERIMYQYIQLGLKVVPANKAVDAGILMTYRRMSEGKLKIFSHCQNVLKEFRVYRRDDKGNVVKVDDHLMDALRYLVMTGVNAASVKPDLDDEEFYTPKNATPSGASDITGY